MEIIGTSIKDLVILQPKVYIDERGYFMESYKKSIFNQYFPNINFIQDNESRSSYGVLRGLHFQLPPYEQTKLVRVTHGKVLDVALDLRKDSSTYCRWESIILSSENKKQFLIPKGFAHGFIVLSDEAIFSYKVDNYYSQKHESGINYNDPELRIDWKLNKEDFKISEKDIGLPYLKDL